MLLPLPDRDEARAAARHELARHAYQEAQPPWYVRLGEWVLHKLQHLLDRASSSVPGGGWGLLALVLLVLLLLVLVLVRLRPTGRAAGSPLVFDGERHLTAAEHRTRADRAVAEGDLALAVSERFRAVVRELEARGVLDPRPGRTADEVAGEAGRALPQVRVALARGAELFDEVRYGGREGQLSSYREVVALDEQVVLARLVPA